MAFNLEYSKVPKMAFYQSQTIVLLFLRGLQVQKDLFVTLGVAEKTAFVKGHRLVVQPVCM